MKATLVFLVAVVFLLVLSQREGFKNVAFTAENKLRSI